MIGKRYGIHFEFGRQTQNSIGRMATRHYGLDLHVRTGDEFRRTLEVVSNRSDLLLGILITVRALGQLMRIEKILGHMNESELPVEADNFLRRC